MVEPCSSWVIRQSSASVLEQLLHDVEVPLHETFAFRTVRWPFAARGTRARVAHSWRCPRKGGPKVSRRAGAFGLIEGFRTPASSVECDLAKGDGEHPLLPLAVPDCMDLLEELLEDLVFLCSGLFGSRSLTFNVDCKHCITVLDGRLSVVLVPGFAEDGRDVVVVLGEDFAFLMGLVCVEDEGFALSSSVVVLSTDTATRSSAVDSPRVIVASALDPEVILSDADQRPIFCRRSLRLITCVRAVVDVPLVAHLTELVDVVCGCK